MTFEQAVEREELRQRFIDQFPQPFYVQEVKYEENFLSEDHMMLAYPHHLAQFYIPGTTGKVLVLPNSFPGKHNNSDDFASSLIDHEYFHLRDFFSRPALSITPKWVVIGLIYGTTITPRALNGLNWLADNYLDTEIRACENQMKRFKKRDCSENYMKHIEQLRDYQLDLKSDFNKGLEVLAPFFNQKIYK